MNIVMKVSIFMLHKLVYLKASIKKNYFLRTMGRGWGERGGVIHLSETKIGVFISNKKKMQNILKNIIMYFVLFCFVFSNSYN